MGLKYLFRKQWLIFAATVADALGYLTVFLFFRNRKKACGGRKNVLVIRMDHIGDVLYATAVPKILKEYFPSARICFLTSSWAAPLLENNPFIDEVLIYDAPWFRKKRYGAGRRGYRFVQLVRALKERKMDVGIGLRGDLRENLLMALAGVKERVGYGITGGGFLLNREVPYKKGVHESRHTLALLEAVGARAETLRPQIYLTEREKSQSAGPGGPSVALQIDAGTQAKEWPEEHLKKFLGAFLARFKDLKLVMVGSDVKKAETLARLYPQEERLLNLAGRTSLRELAALMDPLKLFIGLDSGPAHLALALGVKTLFLYSGTNAYEEWRPLSDEAAVIRKEVPCSPCGLEVCNVRGHPCMSRIEPDELVRAVERNL